ncbi:MAG: hypothetical protein ACTS3F_14635 [Phycisphaerales bacterium]
MGDDDWVGVVVADGGAGSVEESGFELLADLAVRIERHHRRIALALVVTMVAIVAPIGVALALHSPDALGPAVFGMSASLGMFADQWRSLLLARGASVDALLRSAEIESMEHDRRVVARVAGVIAVIAGIMVLVLGNVQSWTGYLQGSAGGAAVVIGYGVVVACIMVILVPRFASSVMSLEVRQSSMVGVRLKGRGVDEVAAVREQQRYLAALRAWRERDEESGREGAVAEG